MGQQYTFAKVAPEDRARFGWQEGTDLEAEVQLDCAACHVLDAGDRGSDPCRGRPGDGRPAPRPGRLHDADLLREPVPSLPHPDRRRPTDRGGARCRSRTASSPAEIRTFLAGTYAGVALDADRNSCSEDPAPEERSKAEEAAGSGPIPPSTCSPQRLPESRMEARAVRKDTAGETIGERVDAKVAGTPSGASTAAIQTCTECHEYDRAGGSTRRLPGRGPRPCRRSGSPTSIRPLGPPRRSIAASATPGPANPRTSDDILMEPIALCQACHAPAEHSGGGWSAAGPGSTAWNVIAITTTTDPCRGSAPWLGRRLGAVAGRPEPLPPDEAGKATIEEFLRAAMNQDVGANAATGTPPAEE